MKKAGNEDFGFLLICLVLFSNPIGCCINNSILWLQDELLNNPKIMNQLIGVT